MWEGSRLLLTISMMHVVCFGSIVWFVLALLCVTCHPVTLLLLYSRGSVLG